MMRQSGAHKSVVLVVVCSSSPASLNSKMKLNSQNSLHFFIYLFFYLQLLLHLTHTDHTLASQHTTVSLSLFIITKKLSKTFRFNLLTAKINVTLMSFDLASPFIPATPIYIYIYYRSQHVSSSWIRHMMLVVMSGLSVSPPSSWEMETHPWRTSTP